MANRKLPTNYLQIQTILFFFKKGLQLRRDSKFYPHILPRNTNLPTAPFVSAQRTMSLILSYRYLSDSRRHSQIHYVKATSSGLMFRTLLLASNKELITIFVWRSSIWHYLLAGEQMRVSKYQMHLLRFTFLTLISFKVTVELVLVWNGLGIDPWQAIFLNEIKLFPLLPV